MKNADYQLSKMKQKLKDMEARRVKSVIWKLSKNQVEYIQNLGDEVTPYLYEIKTRPFKEVRNLKDTILKDIHYANKNGKKSVVKKLTPKQRKILSEYGVVFRPMKYKITIH